MEKKISKNQKMYPHRFGCSQNHPKAPKNPIVALLGDYSAAFRLELVIMRRYSHGEKNIKKAENVPPPFWL